MEIGLLMSSHIARMARPTCHGARLGWLLIEPKPRPSLYPGRLAGPACARVCTCPAQGIGPAPALPKAAIATPNGLQGRLLTPGTSAPYPIGRHREARRTEPSGSRRGRPYYSHLMGHMRGTKGGQLSSDPNCRRPMIEQEQDQDQDWDTALLRLPLGPTQDLAKIGFGANQLLLNRALVQTEISGEDQSRP